MENINLNQYKITLKEFCDECAIMAIHCNTKEKANILYKAFDKIGKIWRGSDNHYLENAWEYYKENTCYSNYSYHGSVDDYNDHGATIHEFEEVDLRELK